MTSTTMLSALPPASAIRLTVSSAFAKSISATITCAPSRAMISAPARPIPEPAPVTIATRSLSIMIFPWSVCRCLFAHQKAREENEDERCDQHHGRDRVDLRRDAAADRGEDIDGQGRIRSRDEEGDDEIVEGKGEGEQEAGEDRRHDLRQDDLPERRQRRGIEIAGGLDDIASETCNARFHDHRHQRHGEEAVCRDDRAIAERELRLLVARPDGCDQRIDDAEDLDQRHQRRNADDDARNDDRGGKEPIENGAHAGAEPLQTDRCHRAEDCGKCRAGKGDEEAVLQRFHEEGVGQRPSIPLRREAGELARIAAGIEGKQHDERDRRIKEEIDESDECAHQTRSTWRVPATRQAIRMATKSTMTTTATSVTAIADPNGQLRDCRKRSTSALPMKNTLPPPSSCGIRYSPSNRIVTSATPVMTPGNERGSVMPKKVEMGLAPRSADASSSRRSSFSRLT
ncbi:hypothetical protein RHSP_38565 [Rhizobium freirei PRF 81]|uniref:Uncharacterized protein n=1 Tax=Rhizobium freirei PRF 81 TaxID=363754 RepID=N6V2M1_9HYPH|nr:hypothetical protein RHSP_38565 [Rhizobium freirei PRF 81]